MLFLAVHSVAEITAKVSFVTILLQDLVKSKNLPPKYKCRHIFPTTGKITVSLWDGPDQEELLQWLKENANADCEHEVFEVPEEFALGLGEIHRARAAEKAYEGTKQIASATVHSVQDFDSKMKISERTGNTFAAVRDSAVVQQTGAALTRAGSQVRAATAKVMEQPTVASAAESVGTGFRRLGESLSSMVGRKATGGNQNPNFHGTTSESASNQHQSSLEP